MLGDLQNARLIIAKGFLFLAAGLLAAGLLLAELTGVRQVILLILCVWCFCRFYYFAFYVIQHYVDDQFRFDGLLAFGRYWLHKRSHSPPSAGTAQPVEPPRENPRPPSGDGQE